MSGKCCQVCSTVAESSCTGCFAVFYCGQEHQKNDWSKHKLYCSKPYTVIQDPVAGRVMVASRDLEIGDIILKEKAALVGPNTDSGSKPICLGCSASVEKEYCLCSICSAPLCKSACQTSALHAEECKILKQNPDALYCTIKHGAVIKRKKTPSHANYQIILVLRALLLKRMDVKKFKSVIGLQSHLEEREEMGTTKGVKEKIIPVLHQYKLQDAYEEMIQNLCGIFDTNCFELFPTGAGDTISGIFPAAAMMMHSCIKNTRLTFSDDHVLTILCRTKVKKGDKIYHSYARTFTPTNIRRIGLFSGKHFSCECIRCADPTELQTFLSAFTCSCGGQILAEDPLDLTTDAAWCCNSCATRTPSLEMAGKERGIMVETFAIKREDPLGLEAFLDKYKTVLHKNHAFILEVEKQLSVAYGNFPGFQIDTLSDKRLARKICYCSHLLDILNILEPGISTQKGLSLHELWKGKEEMLRRLGLNKQDSKYKSEKLKNSALLEESLRILEYEPTNSLHGAVKAEIRRTFKEM